MQCPNCATPLTMSERQGIEIDYCSSCRGVWLDRGEMDKIIERSSGPGPAGGQPVDPYGRDRRSGDHPHHGYGYPKRRKSFLEELFD